MKIYLYPATLLLVVTLTSCGTFNKQQDSSSAQNAVTTIHDFNKSLTPELLSEHLYVVASDSFEGRGTGQPGMQKAADYITAYYKAHGVKAGLEDGYFQNFNLQGQANKSIETKIIQVVDGDSTAVYEGTFSNSTVSAFFPAFGGEVSAKADVIFAGYGIADEKRNIDHLDGLDIKDKWVMIFDEIQHVVDGDTLVSSEIGSRQRLSDLIFRRGAAGLIMVSHFDETEFMNDALDAGSVFGLPGRLSLEYTNPRGGFRATVLNINPSHAEMLLGLSERGTNLSEFYQSVSSNPSAFRPFQLNYTFSSQARLETIQVPTQNIIAVVEGSDPDLKDEYVVVTAHYDHTGIGAPDATGDRIYNGADDDGSGTVAVMTMAKAMNDAKLAGMGPRRSVMFLHVSAEEIGLLGSRYYSDHPTVPVENIIANLNVDMIGRIDEEHEAAGEEDYVYIIGAEIISSGLNTTLNKANELNGNEIRFDMKYNDLTDPNQFYRRSDHWNFGRLGIPFVFYFTGVHVDYHRPSDTPDKILYNKYAKITRQIYSTAAELANNPERPVVDSQEFINITQTNSR